MSKESKKPAAEKKPARAAKSPRSQGTAKKSSAGAGATAKPAAAVKRKPAPKASAAPRRKPAVKPAAKSEGAPATSGPSKPAKKPTVVTVQADIGFGNQMFIRGEGGGLSWDRGVPMECKQADQWQWSAPDTGKPILFKLLINDQLWSHGENEEVQPGETKVVEPAF